MWGGTGLRAPLSPRRAYNVGREACHCCGIDADFQSKAPCRCPCHQPAAAALQQRVLGARGGDDVMVDENDSMPSWAAEVALTYHERDGVQDAWSFAEEPHGTPQLNWRHTRMAGTGGGG